MTSLVASEDLEEILSGFFGKKVCVFKAKMAIMLKAFPNATKGIWALDSKFQVYQKVSVERMRR